MTEEIVNTTQATESQTVTDSSVQESSPVESGANQAADNGPLLFTESADEKADTTESVDAVQTEPEPEIEYNFTIPENTAVDGNVLDKFKNIAKELKLTNDQAQKFIDLQVEINNTYQQVYESTMSEWRSMTEKDSEIGGNKLKDVLNRSNDLVRNYAGAEFEDLTNILKETAICNHPAFIKFLNRVAIAMEEDKIDGTNAPNVNGRDDRSVAEKIFGSVYKN